MPEELPFISYSTKKHVDAGTLSRIRSHAQQRVQDQKWVKRAKIASEDSTRAAAKSSRDVAQQGSGSQFLKLVFDGKSGKQIKRPESIPHRTAARRKKSPVDEDTALQVVGRATHTLSASPGERPDPFKAFPVTVDTDFMDLVIGYSQGWKWPEATKVMLLREQLSQPAMTHSLLAIAYHVWRNDEQRSLVHENHTISFIRQGINSLDNLPNSKRQELAVALMWSIIRLATIKVNQGQLEPSLNHLNALALVSPTMKEWRDSPYAPHFQSAIASLLLANFSNSDRVQPLLQLPFGRMDTSAVDDVRVQGFLLPESAVMAQPSVQGIVQYRVHDAILALTALYHIDVETGTSSDESLPHVHTGKQASEAVKVALRLAKHSTPRSTPLDDWDWLSDFQECVRLTGLLFTWTFGRRLFSRSDAICTTEKFLRASFTSHAISQVLKESIGNPAVVDLLLWMLIVCGSASNAVSDKQYYAELVRTFMPGATYVPYCDIRRLGERLPWIEAPSVSPTEEFWNIVGFHVVPDELEMGSAPGSGPGWLIQGFSSVPPTPKPPLNISYDEDGEENEG